MRSKHTKKIILIKLFYSVKCDSGIKYRYPIMIMLFFLQHPACDLFINFCSQLNEQIITIAIEYLSLVGATSHNLNRRLTLKKIKKKAPLIPISNNLLDMRCRMNIQYTNIEMIDMLKKIRNRKSGGHVMRSNIKANQSIAYWANNSGTKSLRKKHLTTSLNYDGILANIKKK